MGLFSTIGKKLIRPTIKGLKSATPKLIKGFKSSGTVLTKGIKRAKNVAKSVIDQAKALLGMPRGVVKETVIKRGTKPLAKIAGKFDESLIKMKPLKEISRQPFVKQTLTKAQRLANAKSAMKAGKQIKNLF